MARPDPFTPADLEERFTYHPPKPGMAATYDDIRGHARRFAGKLVDEVPPGRELALALTKLEECVMWANAGLARGMARNA